MSVAKIVSVPTVTKHCKTLRLNFQNLEALKSLCLLLNKKRETAFEVLNIPSKRLGHDKHPHESQNRLAKNSEHAIDGRIFLNLN